MFLPISLFYFRFIFIVFKNTFHCSNIRFCRFEIILFFPVTSNMKMQFMQIQFRHMVPYNINARGHCIVRTIKQTDY